MARRARVARCPDCYRPADAVHRSLGRCPGQPEPRRQAGRQARSQRGYVPPSRSGRVRRDEYLDAVRTTTEQKRANRQAAQRRYRAGRAAPNRRADEEARRGLAVEMRLAGMAPGRIAAALGRSDRWVRKWVARHEAAGR